MIVTYSTSQFSSQYSYSPTNIVDTGPFYLKGTGGTTAPTAVYVEHIGRPKRLAAPPGFN